MLRPRSGAVLLATALYLAATGMPAHADVFKPVDCQRTPDHPKCKVVVDIPGSNEDTGGSGGNSGNGSSSGGGDDGCTYQPVDREPPAGKTPADGGWFVKTCFVVGEGSGGWQVSQPIWIDGPGPAVDPAVIARQAIAELALPSPDVKINPAPPARQLTHLPTWLWLDDASWATQSATASVPGLSVTAVAKPTKFVFMPGDGSRAVTCIGRGTPWSPNLDADEASLTCGHTYTRAGTRTITATVTWQISWAGGGQTGTVPDLTTTASRSITVTESQGLNTTRG